MLRPLLFDPIVCTGGGGGGGYGGGKAAFVTTIVTEGIPAVIATAIVGTSIDHRGYETVTAASADEPGPVRATVRGTSDM